MVQAGTSRGAASGARRALALALLVAAPLLMAGCHDEERLRQRLEGPPARLPVEPDQPTAPPAPALLDTVRPWTQPAPYGGNATDPWQLVALPAGDDRDVTYRVPELWLIDAEDGVSRNARGGVEAHARLTQLDDSDISLASYAAQLAEGNAIYQYPTTDGHVVYLTRREVRLTPSDPHGPSEVFHTAVVSVGGRITKLDVRYDSELDWQFDELAGAITGTLQVRRHES
ncbi:MAG: hypothetical protein JWM86_1424 [Thermoleophilia bacterium]|nr:hypothetical protein [Thermoleophilia bacterium]